MEYYRAVASSQLSSLLGDKGVAVDRLTQILGFVNKSKDIFDKMPDKQKEFLNSYVRGVNSIRKKLFHKNRIARNWSASDIISILLVKEWGNAFLNNKELFFSLPAKLKKNRELIGLFPSDLLTFYKDSDFLKIKFLENMKVLVEKYIGSFNRGTVSYVSGTKTFNQKYKVAMSYDNGLNIYPGWYPVSIRINDKHVRGVTFSGMPFIFSSSTNDLSFVGFNVNADVQDFFLSPVKKINDEFVYLKNSRWKKFTAKRISSLKKTKSDSKITENIIIWQTDFGVVLNDIFDSFTYDEGVFSLKSSFPDSSYIVSLFKLPFANNRFAARNFVSNVASYPKVYLFADNKGAFKTYSGKIPVRSMRDKAFKVQSSSYETNFSVGTVGGSLIIAGSSMEKQNVGKFGRYLFSDKNKSIRMKNLLRKGRKLTTLDLKNVMKDDCSIYAEKFVPEFLSILNNIPITSARLTRIYFKDWNYKMSKDLVAPSIYNVIVNQFLYETIYDELGSSVNGVMNNYTYLLPTFYKIVNRKKSILFNDTYSEKNELIENTFDKAFLGGMRLLFRKSGPVMGNWTWGNYHKGSFYIPLTEKSFFSHFLSNKQEYFYNGGVDTIMKSDFSFNFKLKSISSLMIIYDSNNSFVDLNFSYSVSPFSKFYYGNLKKPIFVNLSAMKEYYEVNISPQSSIN